LKRPGPAKKSGSKGLPSAPASVTPLAAKREQKAAKSKPKAVSKTLPKRPDRALPKRPAKVLKATKKAQARPVGKVGLFTKLSPEAKRFVAASRQRKIIALSVTGSFGLLILLILATMFTPLLAVEKLEVTGTHRINHQTVLKALNKQIGVPLPMVNTSAIAESLAPFALVDSFAVVSLPPHTLRIAITERQPICIVTVAGIDYLYDPAGVRVGAVGQSDNYPRIAIVGDPKGSVEFSAAIDVLLALPADLLGRIATVDAKSKDDVSMRLRGNAGQRIVWGDGSQSVLKSKVLAALIKNQKKTDYVTFDVSSPTAPVVRYGNF
jgi:cell division protein FtsQ